VNAAWPEHLRGAEHELAKPVGRILDSSARSATVELDGSQSAMP
jgi:hypothetical protein